MLPIIPRGRRLWPWMSELDRALEVVVRDPGDRDVTCRRGGQHRRLRGEQVRRDVPGHGEELPVATVVAVRAGADGDDARTGHTAQRLQRHYVAVHGRRT